jgi:hypothetical protein
VSGSESGRNNRRQILAGGRGGVEERRKRGIIADFGMRIADLKKQMTEERKQKLGTRD